MSNSFLTLRKDVSCQELIELYSNDNAVDAAMKMSYLEVEKRAYVLAQIKGRAKGIIKFPTIALKEKPIYPPYLSIEQSSSELTSQYKTKLLKGHTLVDLTSGFGVDDYFFAGTFKELTLIEKDTFLFEIVKENFKNMGFKNVSIFNSSAEVFLQKRQRRCDLIYLDPSRRVSSKKVFRLEDCEPNVLQLLPKMKELTDQILIKLSPMMDLSEIHRNISGVSSIHCVSIENECKELLVTIEKNKESDTIHCVELGQNPLNYQFSLRSEKSVVTEYSSMKEYTYLPNASISKAGAFNSICARFNVNKVAPNTHIYTSNILQEDFPGYAYKVIGCCTYKKEDLSALTTEKGFNIIKRNFPDDVNAIAKKLRVSFSGRLYLMAYRNASNKPELCLCEKISA